MPRERYKLQPKDKLDRFVIEHLAGRGGMGEVYRATDPETGQSVALKILRDPDGDTEGLEREAWALSTLKHPGIVRYIGSGDSDFGPYLAMEWLDGEKLSQRLAKGRLSIQDAISIAQSVAEAMSVAHQRGLIHRDLKPSNIFLVGGDIKRVKVLDFGLARLSRALHALTDSSSSGDVVGTPSYMAPEQARGDSTDIDARADIFSLGCVLFECIAGQPPFVAKHAMAVLAKILFEEAPKLSRLRQEVPRVVEDLVAQMLSKDANDRPKDGADVAQRLQFLGGGTPSASTMLPSLTNVEQKVMSVLLATDPQEKPSPRTLREIAKSYGGRLELLSDGSVVVVFGGQLAATDQARQAARCALTLREQLPYAAIALTTGRGEAGPWPVGEVIERAANMVRLESKRTGRNDEILVDEATRGLLDERFLMRGSLLYGKRETWEEGRTLLGQKTTLVGRDLELGSIEGALWRRLSVPKPNTVQGVLVLAPPGVGKSRLVREALRSATTDGLSFSLWFGRADPGRAGSPLGLLSTALRKVIGLSEGDPPEVLTAKLWAYLGRRLKPQELPQIAEFLGELLGAPAPAGEESIYLKAARRDPRLMSDQILRAWLGFVSAECQANPILFWLEDLHWGDIATVQFLEAAMQELKSKPFLVIAAARPEVNERFPRLWQDQMIETIWLSSLSQGASKHLVKQVLGDDLPEELVERICEQAGGNAFYLEELIRAAASGSQDFPETVLAMAQGRFQSLPDEARRLLRAASIFGRDAWEGGTATLLAEDPAALRPTLEMLLQEEILLYKDTSRFVDEIEYSFNHSLMYEAAYAALTEQDRVLGHRLAGEWLESHGEQDFAVLARHFEQGGPKERAALFCFQAAQQALEANDLDGALAYAARGVTAGAQGELLGRLRLLETEVYNWRGEFTPAEQHGLEAMRCLPRASALWFRAASEVAIASGRVNHHDRLMALAKTINSIRWTPELGSAPMIAAARAVPRLLHAGYATLASVLISRIVDLISRFEQDPVTLAWSEMALAEKASAEFARDLWLKHALASSEAFLRIGDRRNACLQRMDAGFAYLRLGQFPEAIETLQEVIQEAESLQLRRVPAAAMRALCLAKASVGQLLEAEAIARRGIELLAAQGDRQQEASIRIHLCLILIEQKKLTEANHEIGLALELLPPNATMWPYASAASAKSLLLLGENQRALEIATDALHRFKPSGGLEIGESFIRLIYAEALFATSQPEAARAALRTAYASLHDRANKLKDPDARDSFLHNIPENARTISLAHKHGIVE